ncbi:LysR family transcriptional regulator [Vibrio fluvialis]|nr:LysR family transcriptional regulator [Vibrio fluvialis]
MNNKIEWSDLRFFLAVGREGTLIGAARSLGVSQPTVGRRIHSLELAIGHKLFQRSADGYLYTDEGLQVLRYAERVENDLQAMERTLAGQELNLDGKLRVSSSDWFGSEVLARYISEFHYHYPKVVIELVTDSRPLNLNRREADLAFRIIPFDDPDIAQRKLITMNYAVYAAQSNQIESLHRDENIELVTMDQQFSQLPDVSWFHETFPKARTIFTSNSRLVQAKYCASSNAIAVLPRALGDNNPALKRLNFSLQPPSRQVWIGYHSDLRSLNRLRVFINFVYQRVSQDVEFGWWEI